MAIGRLELQIPELEGLLALLVDVRKGDDMWHAKRELQRTLDRTLEMDRDDKANIARLRRKRAQRLSEESLTPQSMTQRGWRRDNEV